MEDYRAVCKALAKIEKMAEYIDQENKFAVMSQRILQLQNGLVDKVVRRKHVSENGIKPLTITLSLILLLLLLF